MYQLGHRDEGAEGQISRLGQLHATWPFVDL
jgi:hypothetical protein